MALSPQTIQEHYKSVTKCHLTGEIISKTQTDENNCFTDYSFFVKDETGLIFSLSGSEVKQGCITDTVYNNFDIHIGDHFDQDIDTGASRSLLKPYMKKDILSSCTSEQLQIVGSGEVVLENKTNHTRLFLLIGAIIITGIGVGYYFFKKKTPSKKPVKKITEQEKPELADTITNLTHLMKRRTSWQHKFLSGIMTGLGTVIGATVLSGAIIYVLSLIVSKIDFNDMPIIREIAEQAHLISTEDDEKN